ncbi:hypothetical protein [Vineibacter terrae]|uniref:hypothetical protein n=1 Tax=Vineibacter terrae TaxID=2586908 RepID=UPI002E32A78F|nr:hypothetical protein [Vineibacter terrae]
MRGAAGDANGNMLTWARSPPSPTKPAPWSSGCPTTPGKRRYPNGTDDPAGAITSLSDRGFTGHEHLEEVALVHMNGRVLRPRSRPLPERRSLPLATARDCDLFTCP